MPNGSVLISWQPPLIPNGIVLRYRVERSQSSLEGFTEVAIIQATAPTLDHTDISLTPFTIYYYRVAAENSVGRVTSPSAAVQTPESGRNIRVVI